MGRIEQIPTDLDMTLRVRPVITGTQPDAIGAGIAVQAEVVAGFGGRVVIAVATPLGVAAAFLTPVEAEQVHADLTAAIRDQAADPAGKAN